MTSRTHVDYNNIVSFPRCHSTVTRDGPTWRCPSLNLKRINFFATKISQQNYECLVYQSQSCNSRHTLAYVCIRISVHTVNFALHSRQYNIANNIFCVVTLPMFQIRVLGVHVLQCVVVLAQPPLMFVSTRTWF